MSRHIFHAYVARIEQLEERNARDTKDQSTQAQLRLEALKSEHELQLANLREQLKASQLASVAFQRVRRSSLICQYSIIASFPAHRYVATLLDHRRSPQRASQRSCGCNGQGRLQVTDIYRPVEE